MVPLFSVGTPDWTALGTIALALFTAGLFLQTYRLARATMDLARASKAELEVQWRPVLIPGRSKGAPAEQESAVVVDRDPEGRPTVKLTVFNDGRGPALQTRAKITDSSPTYSDLRTESALVTWVSNLFTLATRSQEEITLTPSAQMLTSGEPPPPIDPSASDAVAFELGVARAQEDFARADALEREIVRVVKPPEKFEVTLDYNDLGGKAHQIYFGVTSLGDHRYWISEVRGSAVDSPPL